MPKREPLVAAEACTFDTMRRQAMVAKPKHPLRVELTEAQWAHFGRRVSDNMDNEERFKRALVTALMASDNKPDPPAVILKMIRAYLATGTIAT